MRATALETAGRKNLSGEEGRGGVGGWLVYRSNPLPELEGGVGWLATGHRLILEPRSEGSNYANLLLRVCRGFLVIYERPANGAFKRSSVRSEG